ncbi:MAG: hypothetical protein HFJ84_11015 [Clostridiales bacterium]|jgi:hypothetical protein|nr:hypothetical protein [Clostridiales bacterium]
MIIKKNDNEQNWLKNTKCFAAIISIILFSISATWFMIIFCIAMIKAFANQDSCLQWIEQNPALLLIPLISVFLISFPSMMASLFWLKLDAKIRQTLSFLQAVFGTISTVMICFYFFYRTSVFF